MVDSLGTVVVTLVGGVEVDGGEDVGVLVEGGEVVTAVEAGEEVAVVPVAEGPLAQAARTAPDASKPPRVPITCLNRMGDPCQGGASWDVGGNGPDGVVTGTAHET